MKKIIFALSCLMLALSSTRMIASDSNLGKELSVFFKKTVREHPLKSLGLTVVMTAFLPRTMLVTTGVVALISYKNSDEEFSTICEKGVKKAQKCLEEILKDSKK